MIIGNGPVLTGDPDRPFLADGAVLVRDDTVAAVGALEELRRAHPDDELVDVEGRLVMPGLINAHTHAYSAYARGMAVHRPTRDFVEILENLWWRLDRTLELEDVELNAATTFVESLRNGVTTVFDHHSSPGAVTGSLSTMAVVARQAGIRSVLCYEVSDRDGADVLAAALAENAEFMKAANTDEQALVKGLFGLHAAFTLSEASLDAAAEAKDGLPGGFHIHVAEGGVDEVDSLERHGKRIVARLADHGMLGPGTIAAHCVHADPDELDLLLETDTSVVHNPHSNMSNAVGVAPVTDMMRRGLRVGLGTDAYTADMFASAQVAKILQSSHLGDPTVGFGEAARALLEDNPRIAARHFAKPLGILAPGAYADLITLDYRPFTPFDGETAVGHLLFGMSGGLVRDAMVAGSWAMRDREILGLDEERIRARSTERAVRVWAEL